MCGPLLCPSDVTRADPEPSLVCRPAEHASRALKGGDIIVHSLAHDRGLRWIVNVKLLHSSNTKV